MCLHVCMAKEIDMMTIHQIYTYFHIRTLWDAYIHPIYIYIVDYNVRMWSNKTVRQCDKFVTVSSSPQHLSISIFYPFRPFSISLALLFCFLVLAASHGTHVCAAEYPKVNFQLLAQPFARGIYMCLCIYLPIYVRVCLLHTSRQVSFVIVVCFFLLSYGIVSGIYWSTQRKWCGMLNGYKFQSNGRLIVC